MTITNCPKCGSMNITTAGVCANCGWSQFSQVTTVSTRTTGEIEIMLSGKALLDDYKRLLLENRNLKERIAELKESDKHWAGNVKVCMQLIERYESAIAELEAEVTKCHELQDSYCDRIAELEAAQRWIPVSERLPELDQDVFAVVEGEFKVGHFYQELDFIEPDDDNTEGNIYFSVFDDGLLVATHWMPLPEPPNDTQTQTFVYGKDSKPIPCPFCGEIVKECNDVATAAGGAGMSEMSDMFKLVNAMELAKKARVGMELTYFDVIELLGEINSLYEYIDELESAQRWVPVSERLPKESGWYRVGAINVFYEGYTDEVYFEANKTKSGWQSSVRDEIYCWLDGVPELPQPPEVQESEATSCEFCGSNKSDRRMNSIVCTSCGRKIGNIAPPEGV